ncbi:MAG: UvrD-helicase domain-containing protein [Clostridia bacterium]|nr:UvrD-helicase domain-containing protein [Clostridia bacterium]
MFEKAYESEDADFQYLLSCFWRKKKDDQLKKIILQTFEKARERGDYREFLESSGNYTEETFESVCAEYYSAIKEKLSYYADLLADELAYFEKVQGSKSTEKVRANLAQIRALCKAENLFNFLSCQYAFVAKETTSAKWTAEYAEHVSRAAAILDRVKKILKEEHAKFSDCEAEKKAFLESGKTAAALAKYVILFNDEYARLKQLRSVLDYADLQLVALKLLKEEYVLNELREKYLYVFVDEYQDVNPLQEEIISAIGGKNLFLVGDIKQSIYGFRGGKSRFFAEKRTQFEKEEGANALRLSKNFRSADHILNAVNRQFCRLMTTRNSEEDYAKNGVMERGGLYEEESGRVAVHFVTEPKRLKSAEARDVYSVKNGALKRRDERSNEAKTVRKIIAEELGKEFYDIEQKRFRKIGYGDIAVLTRKRDEKFKEVVQELIEEGVPITSDSKENVCDYPEIKTLIDLLRLIDNECQDMPLISVLLSPVGKFTAEELGKVRADFGKNEAEFFWQACRKCAETETEVGVKLRRFYEYFRNLRLHSAVLSAAEILSKALSETGMEQSMIARDNGTDCLKRIERFIAESVSGETLGVHAFLKHLKDVDFSVNYSPSGGENSVHTMTIHSSKGLEFPVVILIGFSRPLSGTNDEVVFLDDRFALASPYYDTENMTTSTTILRRLYEQNKDVEESRDGLNLYYVALTRAKYSLHVITGGVGALYDERYGVSFAERTDFSLWKEYIVHEDPFFSVYAQRETHVSKPDLLLVDEVLKSLSWQYPYKGLENVPIKSSATALISGAEKAFDDDAPKSAVLFNENEESEGQGRVSAKSEERIKRGLAYHAFLENFDFSALYSQSGELISKEELGDIVKETLSVWQKNGTLEKEYFSLLDREKCVEILLSPVFKKLRGKTLYKEQQFLVFLPLKDFTRLSDYSSGVSVQSIGEEVLFQGAIDLLAFSEDGVMIIDYKYSDKDAEYLKAHYAPQLELYKKSVCKIMNEPPERVQCVIVNVAKGFEVAL